MQKILRLTKPITCFRDHVSSRRQAARECLGLHQVLCLFAKTVRLGAFVCVCVCLTLLPALEILFLL